MPLRKAAEALGYTVTWVGKTQEIQVEDSIQRAVLTNGAQSAAFHGKLQVVDLSRQVALPVAAVIFDGRTYVPLAFFSEFFDDVSLESGVVSISPQMCHLD